MPGSTSSHTAPSRSVSCQCCSTCPCGDSTSASVDSPSAKLLTCCEQMECSQGSRSGPETLRALAGCCGRSRRPRSRSAAAHASGRRSAKAMPASTPTAGMAAGKLTPGAHRAHRGMIMSWRLARIPPGSIATQSRHRPKTVKCARSRTNPCSRAKRSGQGVGQSSAERRPRCPQVWQTTCTWSSSAGRNDGAPWPRWVWRTRPISSSSSSVR